MADPVLVTIPAGRVRWGILVGLFQRGVVVPIPGPRSVADFLTVDLGVDPDYTRRMIATVFLDSMVVDDIDRAMLRPGSVLTLSAAMPGLAGATLRRSGYYAAMRADMNWKEEHRDGPDEPASARPGVIVVKLFNLLIPDIGPLVLQRGIVLTRDAAATILGPDPGLDDTAPAHEILLVVAA